MKNILFLAKINIWLICVSLALTSCEKEPEMAVSLDKIYIEAIPTETASFGISYHGEWTVSVTPPEVMWLTVSPLYGKGNETITVKADENDDFTERIAFIVVSGENMKNDTVTVIQYPTLDVAEKIEDDIFRKYCLNKFDVNKDGKISLKEASNALEINVKRRDDDDGTAITTLAGIEYFVNIRELDCTANDIEEIDVSKNKEIRKLYCSFNSNLNKIDVSELSRLIDLHLHSTKIKSIDVSKNLHLQLLTTSNSPISTLDVTHNKELIALMCNDNQLTTLDVSKNTKLLSLLCGNNRLSTIDISKNTDLVNLWCNNQTDGKNRLLKHLDVSNNKKLQTLSCGQNEISSLDLSHNLALTQLRCDDNQLISLDVSVNTRLGDLKCNINNLTGSVDLSNNPLLKYIDLQRNNLDTIYVWQKFDEECTFSADGKIKCYEKDKNAKWVKK